jgi:hypothetical protein
MKIYKSLTSVAAGTYLLTESSNFYAASSFPWNIILHLTFSVGFKQAAFRLTMRTSLFRQPSFRGQYFLTN